LLHPASPYAVTKAAADQYVQMAHRIYHLKSTVLRPINSYGRTGEIGFFTEYLISKMLQGEPCYIGAPDSVRDYMFVEDHVNAYLQVMSSTRSIGQVYNVSPGNPVTNKELAEKLSTIVGLHSKIVIGSYPPGYPQRPQRDDPTYLVLDSTKLRKEVDWHPKYKLLDGLRETVKMWKEKS
jgi:UDP-glucose 4-epimerase